MRGTIDKLERLAASAAERGLTPDQLESIAELAKCLGGIGLRYTEDLLAMAGINPRAQTYQEVAQNRQLLVLREAPPDLHRPDELLLCRLVPNSDPSIPGLHEIVSKILAPEIGTSAAEFILTDGDRGRWDIEEHEFARQPPERPVNASIVAIPCARGMAQGEPAVCAHDVRALVDTGDKLYMLKMWVDPEYATTGPDARQCMRELLERRMDQRIDSPNAMKAAVALANCNPRRFGVGEIHSGGLRLEDLHGIMVVAGISRLETPEWASLRERELLAVPDGECAIRLEAAACAIAGHGPCVEISMETTTPAVSPWADSETVQRVEVSLICENSMEPKRRS